MRRDVARFWGGATKGGEDNSDEMAKSRLSSGEAHKPVDKEQRISHARRESKHGERSCQKNREEEGLGDLQKNSEKKKSSEAAPAKKVKAEPVKKEESEKESSDEEDSKPPAKSARKATAKKEGRILFHSSHSSKFLVGCRNLETLCPKWFHRP